MLSVATVRVTPGATWGEASPPAAPKANVIKPSKDVLATRSTSPIPPTANHGNPGTMHVTPPNN
jgi:hypothetical protein